MKLRVEEMCLSINMSCISVSYSRVWHMHSGRMNEFLGPGFPHLHSRKNKTFGSISCLSTLTVQTISRYVDELDFIYELHYYVVRVVF